MNIKRVPVKSINVGDEFRVTPQGSVYVATAVEIGQPGTPTMVRYEISGIRAVMSFAGKADVYVAV